MPKRACSRAVLFRYDVTQISRFTSSQARMSCCAWNRPNMPIPTPLHRTELVPMRRIRRVGLHAQLLRKFLAELRLHIEKVSTTRQQAMWKHSSSHDLHYNIQPLSVVGEVRRQSQNNGASCGHAVCLFVRSRLPKRMLPCSWTHAG